MCIRDSSEGDFALQALRVPGTSLTQSVEMQMRLEETILAKVPEVERVFARTGTAEIASDPMPPNISDSYVMLKPRDQWPDPKKLSLIHIYKCCRMADLGEKQHVRYDPCDPAELLSAVLQHQFCLLYTSKV